jgi:hypothetical protein
MLMAAVLGTCALASAGWVAAETPSKAPPPAAAAHQHPAPPPAATKSGMGMGMMGGGGMGMGMMAGGTCPMMSAADTQVAVKNTEKGVTITYTSTDPAKVARLQKMAEAMRLMHEANTP